MHVLTRRVDGCVEMTNRSATPWHGLGQLLEGSDIDQWTVQAGMVVRTAVGRDYSVPIVIALEDGSTH